MSIKICECGREKCTVLLVEGECPTSTKEHLKIVCHGDCKDTTSDVEGKEIHTILHYIYDMAGAMYEIGCWGKMKKETKVSRLLTDDIKGKDICNLGAQLTAVLNKINIDFSTALTRAHEQGHEQGKVVGRKEAKDAVDEVRERGRGMKDMNQLWRDGWESGTTSAIDSIDRKDV